MLRTTTTRRCLARPSGLNRVCVYYKRTKSLPPEQSQRGCFDLSTATSTHCTRKNKSAFPLLLLVHAKRGERRACVCNCYTQRRQNNNTLVSGGSSLRVFPPNKCGFKCTPLHKKNASSFFLLDRILIKEKARFCETGDTWNATLQISSGS